MEEGAQIPGNSEEQMVILSACMTQGKLITEITVEISSSTPQKKKKKENSYTTWFWNKTVFYILNLNQTSSKWSKSIASEHFSMC